MGIFSDISKGLSNLWKDTGNVLEYGWKKGVVAGTQNLINNPLRTISTGATETLIEGPLKDVGKATGKVVSGIFQDTFDIGGRIVSGKYGQNPPPEVIKAQQEAMATFVDPRAMKRKVFGANQGQMLTPTNNQPSLI